MKSLTDSAGYTLNEMLVALLIVGLAMGGLVQASALIGHLQDRARQHITSFETGRRLQLAFSDLMDGQGPIRSSSSAFDGDAKSFHFDCGNSICGARLAGARLELDTPARETIGLGSSDTGHFEYVGTATTGDTWPPEGDILQRLSAVTLVGGLAGAPPIASAPIWRQEEAGCQFDVIAKDCRGRTP